MTNPSQIISGFNLSLDQGIAQQLGVDAALVYNHIIYWLRINAKKSDPIEDKYWMYETYQEMADFFGFFSDDQIAKAIKKLTDSGLIIKKCLSKNPFDRTYWYSVPDQTLIKKFLRNPEIRDIDSEKIGLRTSEIRDIVPPKSATSEPRKSATSTINTTEYKEENNNNKAVDVDLSSKEKPNNNQTPELKFSDHDREQLNNFTHEQIAQATEITHRNCIQRANHSRVKFFLKTLENLKDKTANKPKLTPYEILSKQFKSYGIYGNSRQCFISSNAIAFASTTGYDHTEFSFEYFSWDKFDAYCKQFNIKYSKDL